LLSGLDATEIPLSGLERTHRLDAEFFGQAILKFQAEISRHKYESIAGVAMVSDGNHFSISEHFQDFGIPYYRGQDVTGHFFIEQATPVCIDQEAFQEDHMVRSHLKQGDVLLSIVGTIGELALVGKTGAATCSCKLAILRPERIQPEYLAIYLKSKQGNANVRRYIRGAVQMGLLLEDMDQLPVVRFEGKFETAITTLVQSALKKIEKSRELQDETEKLVFESLGLTKWNPNDASSCIRSASDVFRAERFDAEYFRPRYQSLLALLRRQGKTLRDVARLREDMFTPQPGQPFHYIEIGDLAADGAATSHVVPGEEAPSRATWMVQPGDVITSTVRPIRCLTGLIEPEQAGNICSSGFAVLTPKGIPGELLFAYLRLPVICELMDLHTTASMYPAISTTDLMRLPFLLPDDATIKNVKQQITAARAARREAHALLEKAKQAVEVAIEKNEAAGMALLAN
jgi:hypothetical protein